MDLLKPFHDVGVIAVVTVATPEHAEPIARALLAGGLSCIEITFRSEAAGEAIELIRERVPEVLVGAGTILNKSQADAAIAAGAAFLVAPGFNPPVVDYAISRDVAIVPGIATPTELEAAMSRDLRLVKVFPIAPLGGPAFLKALAGPYPSVSFVPTGGVNPGNLADYLAVASVAAVGGTWLVKPDVAAAGDWATIERLAADAAAIVTAIRPRVNSM